MSLGTTRRARQAVQPHGRQVVAFKRCSRHPGSVNHWSGFAGRLSSLFFGVLWALCNGRLLHQGIQHPLPCCARASTTGHGCS
eukprot:765017-Pelagomonas_calceolata.AAC.6